MDKKGQRRWHSRGQQNTEKKCQEGGGGGGQTPSAHLYQTTSLVRSPPSRHPAGGANDAQSDVQAGCASSFRQRDGKLAPVETTRRGPLTTAARRRRPEPGRAGRGERLQIALRHAIHAGGLQLRGAAAALKSAALRRSADVVRTTAAAQIQNSAAPCRSDRSPGIIVRGEIQLHAEACLAFVLAEHWAGTVARDGALIEGRTWASRRASTMRQRSTARGAAVFTCFAFHGRARLALATSGHPLGRGRDRRFLYSVARQRVNGGMRGTQRSRREEDQGW